MKKKVKGAGPRASNNYDKTNEQLTPAQRRRVKKRSNRLKRKEPK